jgi:hypothetical protein
MFPVSTLQTIFSNPPRTGKLLTRPVLLKRPNLFASFDTFRIGPLLLMCSPHYSVAAFRKHRSPARIWLYPQWDYRGDTSSLALGKLFLTRALLCSLLILSLL